MIYINGCGKNELANAMQVRFASGAERAQEARQASPDWEGPLQGEFVHVQTARTSRQPSNGPALRRLVTALGGTVSPLLCANASF